MSPPSPCLLYTHTDCLRHYPGVGHPEQPDRLRAVIEALRRPSFSALQWRPVPLADASDLELAHAATYVRSVKARIPKSGLWNLDPDTVVGPGSFEAALRAAGAVGAAVDAVCRGEARTAFCVVRPPGHHAEREHALGFCLFNNLAVGTYRARRLYKLRRVAIVDIDAHHGNGAQNIFWHDSETLVISIHQWPLDLPTGASDEQGVHGNILNIPLPGETGSSAFRDSVSRILLPRLQAFQPELIMVAAGFDAHRDDPLSGLKLVADDFRWLAYAFSSIASTVCRGRIVASLEGGYNLAALGASAAAFVEGLVPGLAGGH